MKKFIGFLAGSIAILSAVCLAFGANTQVYGDADNNGVVDVKDAAAVLDKVLTNKSMPIEENADYKKYIDLNNDGVIDSADVSIILQMALNKNYKPSGVPDESTTEATTEATTSITTDK